MKALVLSTEGEVSEVELVQGGGHEGLHSMYRAIGVELIDCVALGHDLDMWVDDEGLINGSPINIWATMLRQHFYNNAQFPYPLAGNALLTGGVDSQGMTLPISEERNAYCRKLVEAMHRAADAEG